jgi:hypothetical protein
MPCEWGSDTHHGSNSREPGDTPTSRRPLGRTGISQPWVNEVRTVVTSLLPGASLLLFMIDFTIPVPGAM